jgi:hypothetical protein
MRRPHPGEDELGDEDADYDVGDCGARVQEPLPGTLGDLYTCEQGGTPWHLLLYSCLEAVRYHEFTIHWGNLQSPVDMTPAWAMRRAERRGAPNGYRAVRS